KDGNLGSRFTEPVAVSTSFSLLSAASELEFFRDVAGFGIGWNSWWFDGSDACWGWNVCDLFVSDGDWWCAGSDGFEYFVADKWVVERIRSFSWTIGWDF